MAHSPAQLVVILLASMRGVAGTALGAALLVSAANDDSAWGALIAFGGVLSLAIGVLSLAQAVLVWSGRPRLMATAAVIEAGHLMLWLWALGEEHGSSRPLVHLVLVASIASLCALAASMWRRGRMPVCES